jgi:hypothetical protein
VGSGPDQISPNDYKCNPKTVVEGKIMTKEQAINARYRQEFHHVNRTNADGTPVRCRVNGKCKTWKTRPDEFRLPVKYGLYQYFYIDQHNADEWQ